MNSVVVYCCYCYSQGIVVTGEYIHMYKRSHQVFVGNISSLGNIKYNCPYFGIKITSQFSRIVDVV